RAVALAEAQLRGPARLLQGRRPAAPHRLSAAAETGVTMSEILNLKLSVPGEWARIDRIRLAVSHAVAAVTDDEADRDAMAMVAAELLENAIKYGVADTAIELTLEHSDGVTSLVAVNSVTAGSPQPRQLLDRIAWIKGFADPARPTPRPWARSSPPST